MQWPVRSYSSIKNRGRARRNLTHWTHALIFAANLNAVKCRLDAWRTSRLKSGIRRTAVTATSGSSFLQEVQLLDLSDQPRASVDFAAS